MNVSYAFMLVMTVFAAILLNQVVDSSKDNFDSVKIEKRSTNFLIYSNGLDNYLISHPSYKGDVTTLINVPQWLGNDNTIKAYADNGVGYIYTSNAPSLLSAILTLTDGSSQIGVSNASQIITSSGNVAKPSYIPDNYVVYIR